MTTPNTDDPCKHSKTFWHHICSLKDEITIKSSTWRRESDFYCCGGTNGGGLNGREGLLNLLTACSAGHLWSHCSAGNPPSHQHHSVFRGHLAIFLCWNIGPPGSGKDLSLATFFRGNLDEYLFKFLKLKLLFSPHTESREGSWMTYWLLLCCYGNARLFCANKKEPLVSQEDTSPPNQPQPHNTRTIPVFNQTMFISTPKRWS